MQLLEALQAKIWEPDHENQIMMLKFLLPSLARFPLLAPMLIGILAGVCEETLFRGPILAGMLRRLSKWPAVIITALLFAAAHLDLYGMPVRTLLGILLGWMVVRTGSVFPAMVMHATYDITTLLHASGLVRRMGVAGVLEMKGEDISLFAVAGGALLVILGTLLLWTSSSPSAATADNPQPGKSAASPG